MEAMPRSRSKEDGCRRYELASEAAVPGCDDFGKETHALNFRK